MAGSTAVVIGDAEKSFARSLDATRAIKVGPTDREASPIWARSLRGSTRERVEQSSKRAQRKARKCRGWPRRETLDAPNGFFLGATILDEVQQRDDRRQEEIFGPVLNVMRFDDLNAAIEMANRSPYGNGASISPARQSGARVQAPHQRRHGRNQHRRAGFHGLVPFQRLGRIVLRRPPHAGREGIQFFTQQKVTTTRWFSYGEGDIWHACLQ